MSKNSLLRTLPKVDEALEIIRTQSQHDAPAFLVKKVIRETIELERKAILAGKELEPKTMEVWLAIFNHEIHKQMRPNLRRMINGTGVVIHTNLGRSLLSEKAGGALAQAARYYSNLEFNIENGKRGSRYSLVEDIICDLTGAEAAIVVNNNAAAVFLALDTLCKDTEVIVSRGQLVEIGGSFRIPDVMAKSGAQLVEVGATNRTHLFDYENAITEQTSMLLRVHTSNFRVVGFTSEVAAEEMVSLARQRGLITMEDLGSGSLLDLSTYGLPKEPTVQELVRAGVDVITFSGDKLLGGPQAGIIVGSSEFIGRIKKNPLNRAFRIDKFTLASLEVVLREYYDIEGALQEVPTLRMLTASEEELKKRAQKMARRLRSPLKECCDIHIVKTNSRVGGGAYPEFDLPSYAVEIYPQNMKMAVLEKGLRNLEYPIIGRVENDRFFIDARTIQDDEITLLCDQLLAFLGAQD